MLKITNSEGQLQKMYRNIKNVFWAIEITILRYARNKACFSGTRTIQSISPESIQLIYWLNVAKNNCHE